MPRSKGYTPSKSQLRNLKQNKDLTDEQFDTMFEEKLLSVSKTKDFESRIQQKLEEYYEEYDIDDLKINDKLLLRSLIQAQITLEDLENVAYHQRMEGITGNDLLLFKDMNMVMSSLRKDISKTQDDLKITRRVRKGDTQESVLAYITSLQEKAKRFYEQRMSYILCPKCDMLLSTIWNLYPEANNKISLVCQRKYDDGSVCGEKFSVTTKELLENRGFNTDRVPPGMK